MPPPPHFESLHKITDAQKRDHIDLKTRKVRLQEGRDFFKRCVHYDSLFCLLTAVLPSRHSLWTRRVVFELKKPLSQNCLARDFIDRQCYLNKNTRQNSRAFYLFCNWSVLGMLGKSPKRKSEQLFRLLPPPQLPSLCVPWILKTSGFLKIVSPVGTENKQTSQNPYLNISAIFLMIIKDCESDQSFCIPPPRFLPICLTRSPFATSLSHHHPTR